MRQLNRSPQPSKLGHQMKGMKGAKELKAEIKEAGILEIKALTLNKGIFKQLEQVTGEQTMGHILVGSEDPDPWNPCNWVGYVLEPWVSSAGDAQTDWYIIEMGGTLKKVRGSDLWFHLRSVQHPNPTNDLQQILRQVFLK